MTTTLESPEIAVKVLLRALSTCNCATCAGVRSTVKVLVRVLFIACGGFGILFACTGISVQIARGVGAFEADVSVVAVVVSVLFAIAGVGLIRLGIRN